MRRSAASAGRSSRGLVSTRRTLAYIEDEKELDEDGAKGQDAGKQHAGRGVHVPQLCRHLAGNLVRGDGVVVGLEGGKKGGGLPTFLPG